jgi:hypothetical protein
VDLLSDDLRRRLADPKVIIPDQYFVLALDFSETEFQQPVPLRKPLPGSPLRATSRRLARPAWTPPERGEEPGLITP